MNSISQPAQLQSDQGIAVLTLMTLGVTCLASLGAERFGWGPSHLGGDLKIFDDLSDLSLSFTSMQPEVSVRPRATSPARALPDHCPTAVVDVPTMTADVAVPLIKFFRV
jgi:hypothetical protein